MTSGSSGAAIDEPIELAHLVPADELDELVAAVGRALGCEVAVYDRRGHDRLAGSEAAGPARRAFEHDGETIARFAAAGGAAGQADAALELAATMLGLVVHHANVRALTSATHDAAMRHTFSELTEHNTRLQRAVARLEELDRLKSNFLATMSHELRTPLTSVIGYAEMLVDGLAGPLTSEQTDYLTTILGKADQLLGLITTVLEVSSLESGQLQVPMLDRGTLALAEVVATEVAQVAPQADRRGIAIHLEMRGDSFVLGDRRKIRQVVSSLLSNAVKFTPDRGRVGVIVQPGPLSPNEPSPGVHRAIQLVVKDSGIGIPGEQVGKIFEPFFQVDSSSTRAFGGTGLGLTLAKAYVEAHGGRIWVDTTPGQGSTFVATFPIDTRGELPAQGVD
nr:HAMP domain-containing sensor histidine kinase [Kofleriaceae bacterium]